MSRKSNPRLTSCPSNKKGFASNTLAEEALLEAHHRNYYKDHNGPVNIYECDDCGQFHLTSKGELNTRLKEMLASGRLNKIREANFWESKLKKR